MNWQRIGNIRGKALESANLQPMIDLAVAKATAMIAPAKNGEPGRDGRDVDMAEVKALILHELSTWPLPINGKDGADGLGFDDWDLSFDPARGVVLRLSQGTRVKEFICPQPFHLPDWVPGMAAPKGGSVQWDGGYWLALRETTASPKEGIADWQLLVRRGKQGSQGAKGDKGDKGLDAKSGPGNVYG